MGVGGSQDGVLSSVELAQVVHDLKNPLTVVTLESAALQHQLNDGSHEDMVRALGRVLRNLDYLDRMIEDLLDACTFDAERFDLRRKPTELRALVESATLRMIGPRDADRLVIETPERVVVRVDPLRIERVIANLVHNALRYAPPPARVVVRLDVSTTQVKISVADSGPGIAEEDLERIFEPYHRAEEARLSEGHGLGLYASRRIVAAHGGRIGVVSKRGVGSRFYVELPRAG